jgi:methionyl-tRNA formyltransferase
MKTYVILTNRAWNYSIFDELSQRRNERWILIENSEDFKLENLKIISPDIIFIPHWSNIIKEEIFVTFECVLFHMTDLPFGRGGSPLQNLISLGFSTTKISAIRVEKGIDTGLVYLKKDLNLEGSALDIFNRAALVILDMIIEIITNSPVPIKQIGEVVKFTRRKPEQSDISNFDDLNKLYDQIRMLDAPGYPNAFCKINSLKIEFFNASLNQNEIIANVRITTK